MKYLLDTDIIISMIKNRGGIRERMIREGLDACAVSSITIAELNYGAFKSAFPDRGLEEVRFVEHTFSVLPMDSAASRVFGQLKASLERAGIPVDNMDLFIAATALSQGLRLITGNLRHFVRIPGLSVEDWTDSN